MGSSQHPLCKPIVWRWTISAAAEVLSHRYGDCKDKATLLETFLEAEGLHGQTALINSRMQIETAVPSPMQFDHAITYLELKGQPIWLDSTLGVGPFMYLLPQLRGKQSLVVFTNANPVLAETSQNLTIQKLHHLAFNGSIDKQSKVNGVLSFDSRGDTEVLLRLAMMTLPPGQLAGILEKAAASQGTKDQGLTLTDLKADDPMDTSKPFHMEVRIAADAGKKDSEKDSSGGIDHLLHPFFTAKQLESILPDNAGASSDHSLRLYGPAEYSLEVSLTIPSAAVAGKPESVHLEHDFADFESTREWNDRTFYAKWRIDIRVPEIPGNQLKEYAFFRKDILDQMLKSEVDSSKATKTGPPADSRPAVSKTGHIPPFEAARLLNEAEAEMKLQNWANAEQKVEAAIKIDPEDKDFWNELGVARMYLRQYDAAETAFRKLMEIAPDDHLSNMQIAWVLTAEKKYEEAAQSLKRWITAVPNDGDAHRRLGLAYLDMKLYDKAVPELQKATMLIPKNNSAHFLLGRAYLKTHYYDQGAKEFEAALAIESNDRDLNSAAYELALEKAGLDLAETWSLRTVHDMETELNQAAVANLTSRTMTYASRVAEYWDTLGWIKFQKNDFTAAEKYTKAAWQLNGDVTMGYHLGRIYEALQRKDEAIEMYAQILALAAILRATQSEPSNDEKDGRMRLASLLKDNSTVDARVAQASAARKERRSVAIENKAGTEAMVEYVGVAGPGGKIIDLRPSNPQNQFEGLTEVVRSATVPLSFPDDIQKLPFRGVVICLRADQPCKLNIMSAGNFGEN